MTKQKHRTTTLGEELPLKYGKARRGDIGLKNKNTPVYGSSGIFDTFERKLTNGPTLIVGRKGSVGSIFLTSEGCWPIDTVFFAEPKEGQYLPYFKYLLEGLKLKNLDRSTAVPGLSRDDYNKIKVTIPEYEIQKSITEEIETQFTRLDAGVAALKRAQANLKRYRAAVLKAACEGKLAPTEAELAKDEGRSYETGEQLLQRILVERKKKWEAEQKKTGGKKKYVDPKGPDVSSLPKLPKGWAWAHLPQLGELNRGKSKHRPRDAKYLYGGRYPFIQTGDIRKANGKITKHTQTYSEAGLKQSRLWPSNTLCITIAANIAETSILTFPACFPDSIAGFIAQSESITTYFVELFIRTAKERLEKYAPATAQKNININVLSNLAVPLPPLREQQRIVDEMERQLSVMEEMSKIAETNLLRAKSLKQTILQKQFYC